MIPNTFLWLVTTYVRRRNQRRFVASPQRTAVQALIAAPRC